MRNEKGITMSSLVIYIMAFVIILGIVGTITVFFSSNAQEIDLSTSASSEYNKFNLYMLKYAKSGYDVEVKKNSDNVEYIEFSKNGEKTTFIKLGNMLYFNEIKLCEDVDDFIAEIVDAENGKKVLKTYIEINKIVYTTDYTIE